MQAFWFLEHIDVTHILCPNKLGDAGRMAHHVHRTYTRGQSFFVPDDFSDRIFFITDGRVKISTTNDEGKEITKAILGKGEVFGELALVGEERRRDWAVALENTTVCVVTLDELRALMRERSDLNLFFMRIFGTRQLEMERRLESLVFRDSRSRIVEFLVQLTRAKAQRVGYEWVIRKPITHQEIANLTATSRQTVTTTLNDLRFKKLLTFNRSRLLVRDLDALAAEIRP
ncbi:MAG: Crp/Fnr family transcriptional regulator [Saprospirales bacterium]|jgi:CRP/FNR family cyclic AMP-dependent transcriptional regulator|nr:Crp/Fnr family transcriptional regulator [Saprospirales bacterium]MBK8923403.1 Crp/Fnr family transcriptional regulator [Saprospirales bacterium]